TGSNERRRAAMKCLSRIERLLLIAGSLLIAIYVMAHIHKAILSRTELRRFRDLRTQQPVETPIGFPAASRYKVDFSLWSEQRLAAYERSLCGHGTLRMAALRISKVLLEAPEL